MIAVNVGGVTLLGRKNDTKTADLESFLSRNYVPYEFLEVDEDHCQRRLEHHRCRGDDLPVLIAYGQAHANPTNRVVAEALGFTVQIDCGVTYDVVIVGSGPAGMAAAVYAASEGLRVLVLDRCAPGGQAASSSKIENYMGFPTGISGQALMGRGHVQAQKFGAHIAIARELLQFECDDNWHKLRLDGDDFVYAHCVIIATGAVYRQPNVPRLDELAGVHYGASYVEAQLCRGRDIAIIGGGNSAGQAAVYLAKRARHINLLVRGDSLSHSMSDYLIQRIHSLENVTLHTHHEVVAVHGETALDGITVRNKQTETEHHLDVGQLFVFIGAQPGTDFVNGSFHLDEKGFVVTGRDLSDETLVQFGWPLVRAPFPLESSCPRVFAVGDVRSLSTKRVASAVGEGSVCVQFVHAVLSDEIARTDGAERQ